MPAHEWTTPAQREFLLGKLSAYLVARGNSKKVSLSRYWTILHAEYFLRWPERQRLGLAEQTPNGVPLTAEENVLLGKGIHKTKERLKGWMRYRDTRPQAGQAPASRKSSRTLFRLLKTKPKKRPLRTIEAYQKMFPTKIQNELDARGFRELNVEVEVPPLASYIVTAATNADAATDTTDTDTDAPAGVTVRVMTEEEIEAEEERLESAVVASVRSGRSGRMKMRRRVTVEMFDTESDEVKRIVKEELARLNLERMGATESDDDSERTPEEYQHAIDQFGHVMGKVSEAIFQEMGWVGYVMCGGPMPRRSGDISIKTTGWGKTALGCDFPASYPEIENVKGQFASFVKRVFSHDVRDERALSAPIATEDALDGVDPIALDTLISLDGVPPVVNLASVPVPLTEPTTAAKRKAPTRVHRKAPVRASTSAPDNAAAAGFVAPAPPNNSAGSVTPAPPSYPPIFVASPAGPALHLPEDFDQVMGDPDFDYDDDTASSTFGFSSGFATDEEDPTLPFPRAFAPNFSSAGDMLLDEGMDGVQSATMEEASMTRPAARPIHRGATFERNREMGGSPGREGSFMPANDYRPSVLFQAFAKPLPPLRSSPLPPIWSSPLARGNNSSPSASSPIVRDCGAAFAAFAASARRPPPSSLPSTDASSSPSSTPLSLPPLESTPFSFPSSNPSSAALTNPFSSLPAPRSTPFSFPAASSSFPTPGHISPQPSAAPAQAVGFSNTAPGAAAQPSALSVFKTTVASATAEVEHERTASAAAAFVPQYIQSRPPANIPKGHPLAPTMQKAAEKQAEKDAQAAQAAPAPARRGRPRKQGPGDENVAADTVRLEEPAPATMSAAARAETARINREVAALRKQSAALRKVEKLRDDKVAAEEKAAERLRASRENPAGGAPLFVTSARPKRAMNAGKNADGTPIIRPKKRGADVMAEEDARIEAAFAAQKSEGAAAAKKRAGAGARSAGAAGGAKKAAAATAPRAGAKAGTRAAVALAAKPAAKKRRT
ncbi:hypothetical protein DFH06DRAFT_1328186 [Mycena polygramma]|nr:hypothetical protein DFH06DRAFT_1328186 [Mycena polygramma]